MPPALPFNMLAASPPTLPVRHRSKSHSGRAPPHLLRTCAETGGDRSDSPDLIERTVDFLFKGARSDEEPFGMKRMNDRAYKEQSVATTSDFAASVPGDDPTVARLIRPLLANTRLETAQLRLAYDAERDGWCAEAFHAKVDTFGAAVVLARTAGGATCGGYNPKGWIGLGEDRDSLAAFLFSWPSAAESATAEPIKLPKVGGAGLAVQDKAEAGPLFGAEGLKIPLRRGDERGASSRLGSYYARLPGGGRSLFAASESGKRAELVSLQVYVADGGAEEWELDGVVWKTKQS